MIRSFGLLFVANERAIAFEEEVAGPPGFDVFPWKAILGLPRGIRQPHVAQLPPESRQLLLCPQ